MRQRCQRKNARAETVRRGRFIFSLNLLQILPTASHDVAAGHAQLFHRRVAGRAQAETVDSERNSAETDVFPP